MATSPVKQEIDYMETLCRELEIRVRELEQKLQENTETSPNKRQKQDVVNELNEVRKLLKKNTEQLNHLKTHQSGLLKLIMALTLVIFIIWMIVVLTSNNWDKTGTL